MLYAIMYAMMYAMMHAICVYVVDLDELEGRGCEGRRGSLGRPGRVDLVLGPGSSGRQIPGHRQVGRDGRVDLRVMMGQWIF
jgi:hypothetical protein